MTVNSLDARIHEPSRQFPSNIVTNISYYIINIIVGVLIVPYFVSRLGIESYGIIPLATAITGYIGIIVHSLNESVSRFITFDIQNKDFVSASKTFSTAILSMTIVFLLLLPMVFLISCGIPSFFNMPEGQEESVFVLVLGVCLALMLRAWSAVYTVQLFANNRLDLINIVNTVNLLVQYGFVILFFSVIKPNLALVGAASFLGAVVASVLAMILAKRICPEIRFSLRCFDCRKVIELSRTGWWLIVDRIGSMLFLQVDLLLVNRFFGARMGGEYAIALQWAILIRSFAIMMAGVLTPTILIYYTRKETERMTSVLLSSIKLLGLVVALPVGLICGLAPALLEVWLGVGYSHLSFLIVLLVAHMCYNMCILPVSSLYLAYNKMKIPGITTIALGLFNIFSIIMLIKVFKLNYYGAAIAGALALTIKNAVFNPLYASGILKISVYKILKCIFPGIYTCFIVTVSSYFLCKCVSSNPVVTLIFVSSIIIPIYLFITVYISINSQERNILKLFIPRNNFVLKKYDGHE